MCVKHKFVIRNIFFSTILWKSGAHLFGRNDQCFTVFMISINQRLNIFTGFCFFVLFDYFFSLSFVMYKNLAIDGFKLKPLKSRVSKWSQINSTNFCDTNTIQHHSILTFTLLCPDKYLSRAMWHCVAI